MIQKLIHAHQLIGATVASVVITTMSIQNWPSQTIETHCFHATRRTNAIARSAKVIATKRIRRGAIRTVASVRANVTARATKM